MNPFFTRREVWVPTFAGTLLILCAVAGVLVAMALNITPFLSLNAPAHGPDGRGAATLVVEGWLDAADLDEAASLYRSRPYERLLTTGGPIESWDSGFAGRSYADRAAAYLQARLGNAVPVVAVPAPASAQDRTYLSAVMVRDWAQRAGTQLVAIDLFTAGIHARRSRWVYRMALGPEVEIGAIASKPKGFDGGPWWASSSGAKGVLGETLSLAWTACCFWPAPRGTHEERWAVPAARAIDGSAK